MRKILAFLTLVITTIFALPDGRYLCIPTSVINSDGYKYKLSDKEIEKYTMFITLKDRTVIDETNQKFKYSFSKDDVDFYTNPNKSYVIGFYDSFFKNSSVKETTGFTVVHESKNIAILGVCKYLGSTK